jgi:hypothetical protein
MHLLGTAVGVHADHGAELSKERRGVFIHPKGDSRSMPWLELRRTAR